MEWRKCYMDLILVPSGVMIYMGYHLWLWHKVRNHPLTTVLGRNACGSRSWVAAIIKDNEKKNTLAVQTFRNMIMGSTLMATTSILLCTALAAVISSSYTIKKPLNDAVYGSHGEVMVALKYVTILTVFLFSFICHSLSIKFTHQVTFLINCSPEKDSKDVVTVEYVAMLLERGFELNTVGCRLFYGGVPLLTWIFGPVLVFVCCVVVVFVLYSLDFVYVVGGEGKLGCCEELIV